MKISSRFVGLLLVSVLALGSVRLAPIANGSAKAQVHNTVQANTNVAEVEDRIQITDLLYRHQIYIDLADAERYADIYASNGVYQSPFASAAGRVEIMAMFRNLAASGFTKNKRHFMGPIMIEITGDQATTLSYWWVADYSGTQPVVFATGRYQDQLQKINGVWKIQKRIQTIDSNTTKGSNSGSK